jgi:hypothetical protein
MTLRRGVLVALLAAGAATWNRPVVAGEPAAAPPQDVGALPLMKAGPGGRNGVVTVLAQGDGLLVRAVLAPPAPAEARQPVDPASRDGIAVWLAPPDEPAFPPIGWGHQFGSETLETAESCAALNSHSIKETDADVQAACRRWFAAQTSHREALAKLFVRHWATSDAGVVETIATPAFAAFPSDVQPKLRALAPGPLPSPPRRDAVGDDERIEILIPWNALPPMASLDLDAVKLRVDVTRRGPSSDAPTATTSEIVAAGRLDAPVRDTLSAVRLAAPRRYFITPCRYALTEALVGNGAGRAFLSPAEDAHVYYVPTARLDLRSVVVVGNEAAGYQYLPDERSLSPIPLAAEFSVTALGRGRFLCGPRLAYADASGVVRTEFVPYADVRPVTKAVGDDVLLVRYGPYAAFSYYGSGQCGACPNVEVAVYRLDGSRAIARLPSRTPRSWTRAWKTLDIAMTPDWRKITFFHATTTDTVEFAWSATMHCLRGATYSACGRASVPWSPGRGPSSIRN